MANPIRPLEGLSSPPRLFADLCGHMVVLGTVLATIALAEAVTRLFGWESRLMFILALLAAFVAIVLILGKRIVALVRHVLPLADRLLPTPTTLQRGYARVVQAGEDDRSSVPSSIYFLLGLVIGVSTGLASKFRLFGSIREDLFLITLITPCILAAVMATILIATSYLVGRSLERRGRG